MTSFYRDLPLMGLGPERSIYSDAVEQATWPPPEVTSRLMRGERSKPAVDDLIMLATAHGWTSFVTEAKGAWPSVGQRPSVQRWSIRIGLTRVYRHAVAVYVENADTKAWAWDTLYWQTSAGGWVKESSIGVFLDTVFGPLCKPSWPGAGDWSCPYFGPIHGPKRPPKGPKEVA